MTIDDTILRQYGNSPKLKSLIYSFNDGMKVEGLIDDFYNKIINLDTANSYGLDIWGKIVNVSRYVKFDQIGGSFGFNGGSGLPFNQAPFYSGEKQTTTLRLADDFFRAVIKAKASVNISNSTIVDTNRILLSMFKEKGAPFVVDNLDMTIHYVFPFYLKSGEISLIKHSNILPRPSGVKLIGIISNPRKTFGFNGSNGRPFNQGTFFSKRNIIDVN